MSHNEIATAVLSCSQIIATLADQLGHDHSTQVQSSVSTLARAVSEVALLLAQWHVVTAVASLPAAATIGTGTIGYFVTDANATTFASIVAGGGTSIVPVYSDGTDWRIG
jgi:hypothetical protein